MAKSEFYRAATIAHAILVIIERDRPNDIADLRAKYWRARRIGDNAASKAVEVWCADMNLVSFEIHNAAEAFAEGRVGQPAYGEPDPDDENWPHYYLPVIFGESKKDFHTRADHQWARFRYAAPGAFNQKHVEWLVRHQVYGVGYKKIAKDAKLSRERVRQAVRAIADIIKLPTERDNSDD
jgi:hypothetical protein